MTFLRISQTQIPELATSLRLLPGPKGLRLLAVLVDGTHQEIEPGRIDGLYAGHGLEPAKDQVIVWRLTGLPGSSRVTVDPGTAAEVISHYGHVMDGNIINLTVSPDEGRRLFPLEIVDVPLKIVDLDAADSDLFFQRLLVPIGAHRHRVAPEFPLPARWLGAIRECSVHAQSSATNALEQVTYTIRLHGLEGTLRLTYGPDDLVIVGDDDENQTDPFQVMVWPNLPDVDWKFFSVVTGQSYDRDWDGASWGLYTEDTSGGGRVVRPCRTRLPTGVAASVQAAAPRLDNLSGTCRQVVTSDRPRYVEMTLASYGAGSTFSLLQAAGGAQRTEGFQLGLDMGTSNTCLSVLIDSAVQQAVSRTESFNFNMVHENPYASGGPASAGTTGLVFVKIGDSTRIRTAEPWLPGIEGPKGAATSEGPQPLTQLPSLVIAMPDHFKKTWPQVTVDRIREALPLRDVVVPPLDFVDSFASITWVERSVTSMKWARVGDEKPQAFLQKYLGSIFLFAAAKLRTGNTLTVKLSYPLTFTPRDQGRLRTAATAAAAEIAEYTGVAVNAVVYTDESRCVLKQYTEDIKTQEPTLVAVCDIGGGSVDIAFGTFNKRDPDSLVFLTADSLRFGANLLFNAMCRDIGQSAFPPSPGVTDDQRAANIREQMRRAVRRSGYDAILSRVGGGQQAARARFRTYFRLVTEYVARTAAAVIRNPYRFYAAVQRLYDEGSKSKPIHEITDLRAGLFAQLPRKISLVFTGNGWRALEVLSPGFPIGDDNPQITALGSQLSQRIHALVREPVSGEDPRISELYRQSPQPTIDISVGLSRKGGSRVIKEALADAVLSYDAIGPAGSSIDTGLATPNGLCEETFDFDRLLSTGSGEAERPWYTFVGALVGTPTLQFRSPAYSSVPEPGYAALPPEIGVPKGPVKPELPPELKTDLNQLGVSGDLGDHLRNDLASITALIRDGNGQRAGSVLSALYVHSLSTILDPEWRWGSV